MKFKKRPVIIDAIQWNPTETGLQKGGWPDDFKHAKKWLVSPFNLTLFIPTLEGTMSCKPGWWVIKGVAGEYYCCEPKIFEQTYEKLSSWRP